MEMTGRVLVVIGVWGRAGLSGEGEEEEMMWSNTTRWGTGNTPSTTTTTTYYILHTSINSILWLSVALAESLSE